MLKKTITNNQLTSQQLKDLDFLCRDCKNVDGNTIAIYRHILVQDRPIPCNILCYQNKKLIGFLSLFFFYEEACEVVLMVLPSMRRKGIATHMMNEILVHIHSELVKTLLFLRPYGLENQWISAKGFVYKSSEYHMQRLQTEPIVIEDKQLMVRLATEHDSSTLCAMDKACFPEQSLEMSARFNKLLNDPKYKLFIAFKDGTPIGKAHLCFEHDHVRLTDIGVFPHFQGQGYGSILLAHCINYCLMADQYPIYLDVEMKNQQALRLYTHLGFSINNVYDLWIIPLDRMDIGLKPTF